MKLAGNAEYCVFTNGRTPIPLSEAKWQKNAFHVFGSWDKRTGKKWTTTNDDIVVKNYLIMDIDIRDAIRQEEKRKIEQSEVIERCEAIKVLLSTSIFFADWSMFVCTGNWCQIYYVWDNAVLEDYYDWMEVLMQEFDDEILTDTPFETDKSMKNLSRLARLPWTINSKPEKPRYNWDQECKTLRKQEKHSVLLKMLSDLAEQERERQEIEAKKKAKEYEEKTKNYRPKDNGSLYDAIEEISTAELFQINRWLELARDWKNFISDKDGCFISAFYDKERNLLHFQNPDSRHNTSWQTTFWPRTYIKYEILGTDSDQQIFEWAKGKYSHLNDLDKKNVEAWKKETQDKELKEKSEIRNWEKLFSNLWYYYPHWPFTDIFWWVKSEELVLVSAWPNHWKTTFVINMLKRNQSIWKKVAIINMEFELNQTFHNEFFKARWYKHSELKLLWTDLHPLDPKVKNELDAYISKRRKEIAIFDMWQGTLKEDIIKKCEELARQWYSMVAIDSLWSIGRCAEDSKYLIDTLKDFRNWCTASWQVVVMIHHFNKARTDYSGSWKARDLCNVTLEIIPATDTSMEYYRVFRLSKDKPHEITLYAHCYYQWWKYVEVPIGCQNTEVEKKSI